MEADAFLTLFLAQVDQVAGADADNTALRTQRLFDLNEVAIDFVQSYDFSWMLKTGTLTIAAAGFEGTLPTDFDNIGAKGGVFRTSDGQRLTYCDPDKLYEARLDPSYRPALPDEYSFFSVTTDGYEVLQTAILGASCGFSLLYKKNLTTITDTSSGSGLNAIPESHQRGVIWAGMMAKAKDKDNDFRSNPMYVAAKRSAIASNQKGKEQGGRLASFFGD